VLKGAFRLVDLQPRKHGELADVRVNRAYLPFIRAIKNFVPQNTVELLREVDDLADLVDARLVVELGKRLLRLCLRLDIAHGNAKKTVISLGVVYQERVVRYKHGIRIVVAAVEPLLDIFADGIDAHDIFA